ncbi:beta-cubebene synthase-like isoform X2 [Tasmannia lanceolata]|uniref:beta-cubebene synthase-like isoform X2 n=1 Tax=Tasmannia lanceolata TaxID=3420 RepID=UPI0040641D20
MALQSLPTNACGSCPTLHSSNNEKEVVRRSANFHPDIWGDRFLAFSSHEKGGNAWATQRIEELKEEVKSMLKDARDPLQIMNLVDALQRLGLAYHFEILIEEALSRLYYTYTKGGDNADDLHAISLQFRLLRQQGYNIPSDVFSKFKDDQGNFNVTLSNTQGMLSLYEAAHLSTHGEVVLDDALVFTRKHLKAMIPHLSSTLARHVETALELPLHKCLSRLNARNYISFYQEQSTKNEVLLELAKLDFNMLQSIHQRELRDISRWWKDIDLPTKLPFARDRIVELYFWILGVYFEPQYCRGRMLTTKIVSFVSVMDDIYDVYGTLEELQLLTNAIQRWDVGAMDKLPEYMKIKCLNRAYFNEAKWFHSGNHPTFEEYINTALISTAYPLLIIVSCIGMDEIVKKEAFDWINSNPNLVRSASIVCRLVDDIQSHKFEQERGHISSSVELYMKEHSCTELEACDKLREMVSVAWKDINQDCIKPTPILMPLIIRIVNLVRVIEVLYQYRDGYTNSTHETKERITLVMVDPIPI